MKSTVYMAMVGVVLTLLGCAKNPVTGKSEFQVVSQQREIRMGEENYAFGQQAGGGIFLQDPELTAYVASVGQKLAKHSPRSDLPYEFVILNESVPNAWAMPGGKIAVNRGLLVELKNEAELAAVLGHEITHAAARHSAKAMERQIVLATGLIAANIALATQENSTAEHMRNEALMAGAQVAAALVTTKYGRHAELEADAYGIDAMVKAGYDPMAAVSLQETFVRLSEKQSQNWLSGLFASHPPSKERVKANLKKAQKLPHNLDLGTDKYTAKMARLKALEPAYKAYDEGIKASQKKEYAKAMNCVNEAIKLAPKEALFYGLKGDLLARSKLNNEALAAYNTALSLDSSYFYYYHQRGKLYKQMGQYAKAQADLRHSQSLLPTEMANNLLQELDGSVS